MSFCPVCGAHHDPEMPCADRAGELLRDAGIKPEPLDKKELKETIKKANRSLLVLLIAGLALFLLIILLSSFGINRPAVRAGVESGNAWLEQKDYDKAIEDFTGAIASKQLSTRELVIAYYNRARAWYGKEDYDKAISDFSEVIRLDPSSMTYYARGLTWLNKGDYDKAIADFNEAVRINPQYTAPYMIRGIARFNRGEFSSAASDLARSQQFNADIYTAIWLYLARVRDNIDGKIELTLNTSGMDTKKWPAPVVSLYLGKADPNTITSQAEDPDPEKRVEQLCEANFFLGEWHLMHRREQQARILFTKAQNDCPKHSYLYAGAVSELQRLRDGEPMEIIRRK